MKNWTILVYFWSSTDWREVPTLGSNEELPNPAKINWTSSLKPDQRWNFESQLNFVSVLVTLAKSSTLYLLPMTRPHGLKKRKKKFACSHRLTSKWDRWLGQLSDWHGHLHRKTFTALSFTFLTGRKEIKNRRQPNGKLDVTGHVFGWTISVPRRPISYTWPLRFNGTRWWAHPAKLSNLLPKTNFDLSILSWRNGRRSETKTARTCTLFHSPEASEPRRIVSSSTKENMCHNLTPNTARSCWWELPIPVKCLWSTPWPITFWTSTWRIRSCSSWSKPKTRRNWRLTTFATAKNSASNIRWLSSTLRVTSKTIPSRTRQSPKWLEILSTKKRASNNWIWSDSSWIPQSPTWRLCSSTSTLRWFPSLAMTSLRT